MFKALAVLIFSTSLFALVDLGTYGQTHSIKEKDFMNTVEEKAADLNNTLIKEQFYEAEKSFMNVKRLLPTCKVTQKRYFTPTFVVPADVVLPNGKVIARAGEEFNTLELMKKNSISLDRYTMFIDASDMIQVQLSYMYKNQGFVFITNGNIKEYEKLTKIQSFKADRVSIEKFDVKCSPSIVVQDENRLLIYEYNPDELKKRE